MSEADTTTLSYWKTRAETAEARISELERLVSRTHELEERLAMLERMLFARKTEKMPSVDRELRDRGEIKSDPGASAKKRKKNAAARKELPSQEIRHSVPDDQKVCPKCGGSDFRPLGSGKSSVLWEYVPAQVVRQVHIQEKLACRCGEHIVTAEGPARVTEGGSYGPGFHAHVVTSKCLDSLPLHRLEKQFKRLGIPVARATLVGLFHASAEALKPIWDYILEQIAASDIVQADETPVKMQDKRTGYLWTFLTDELIGYRYSASRSGRLPAEVLGGSKGTLVVDGYTGYNRTFTPEGRSRAGCLAHARRYFFHAKDSCPEAETGMDYIRQVYRVEHEARERGIVGGNEHSQLREEKSRPIMERFRTWLEEQHHPPKSAMGKAVNYSLNNWDALTAFLDNARIPLDNNASERALRVAALGRKNFLFVGHEAAGENLAGLYSLVATCEAHGVNAQAYLADVLLRVQTHPQSRIHELLPKAWLGLYGQQKTGEE
jgi:transposase